MHINGIVAMDKNKGIGINNNLPWRLSDDLSRFQRLTKGKGNNAIIVGKNTWNSIHFLKGRDHLILSSSISLDYEQAGNIVKTFSDIHLLLQFAREKNYENVWVIGGSQVYNKFLELSLLHEIHITLIDEEFQCDTYFPTIPDNYFIIQQQLLSECTNKGNNTFMNIFKKVEKGMKVVYKHEVWDVIDIHVDTYPKYYFTIHQNSGREVQTVKSNLKIKL